MKYLGMNFHETILSESYASKLRGRLLYRTGVYSTVLGGDEMKKAGLISDSTLA